MDGYWKFDLRDHSFAVPEVQETFQRHVMPRCAYDVITRHTRHQCLQVTDGTGHSIPPSALPSLVLPPLSMLFVIRQGEGQCHSNSEAQQQVIVLPQTRVSA